MMLKAVLIIGRKIHVDQKIIELYNNNPGYIIIGNFKDGVNSSEIKLKLKDKINSNTIITISAHGSLDEDNHFLRLSSKERTLTSTFIKILQKCFTGPLQIFLDSCYSGNSISSIKGLKKESVMITNSKTDYPSMSVLSRHKLLGPKGPSFRTRLTA